VIYKLIGDQCWQSWHWLKPGRPCPP